MVFPFYTTQPVSERRELAHLSLVTQQNLPSPWGGSNSSTYCFLVAGSLPRAITVPCQDTPFGLLSEASGQED